MGAIIILFLQMRKLRHIGFFYVLFLKLPKIIQLASGRI